MWERYCDNGCNGVNAPTQGERRAPGQNVQGDRITMSCWKRFAPNVLLQGLCAALLHGATATVQAATPAAVILPSLTQPASGEHHVGKVIWADLVTPDLDTAKRFYG